MTIRSHTGHCTHRPFSMLATTTGYASLTGPRPGNEDFCGLVTPQGAELTAKGVLAAVADGVGGQSGGREAAEYTVRGLLADYYATPDTWAPSKALDTVLQAQNRWLVAQGAARRELAGMATTLSAVLLLGSRYYTAHIGDSRIYLWREDKLQRLTSDHVWEHPDMQHVLKRAVGLDGRLQIDHGDGDLRVGDLFVLLSDGIWNTLGDTRIAHLLRQSLEPQAVASALAQGAIDHGAQDNCSAVVLRADAVPRTNLRDHLATGRKLSPLPRLKPGEEIDGLRVEVLLHASRITLLYRVRDLASGEQRVLKTLRAEACEREAQNALIYEEWLARRVTSPHFPQVIDHPSRAHLYYLMSWHEGASLQQQLDNGRKYSIGDAIALALDLLRAVAALHRLGIIHRDIKPANIHLGQDGRLRLLDLGVAAADAEGQSTADGEHEAFGEINNPGTPSYMAPELFDPATSARASESSDIYAVGVTLYELLTRRFPYGEIEPFQHPRFGEPVTPLRYRPDIPAWLETLLLKAVARAPRQRFETAEELTLALEHGAFKPLRLPQRTPLSQRDPQFLLKLLAVSSLVLNLLLIFLISAS